MAQVEPELAFQGGLEITQTPAINDKGKLSQQAKMWQPAAASRCKRAFGGLGPLLSEAAAARLREVSGHPGKRCLGCLSTGSKASEPQPGAGSEDSRLEDRQKQAGFPA